MSVSLFVCVVSVCECLSVFVFVCLSVCAYVSIYLFRARSHTGVMDYDETYFMHLTHGVVQNFPKVVGV